MLIRRFDTKIVTPEIPIQNTFRTIKITDRISPELYREFSNLNFAGVYRIGSKTERRDCYIGSAYNLTDKITHHLNLLYRGVHHSKGLQDWVTKNGIENIDVSVLAYSKANPDDFEGKEQYYLNLIKPNFNSILNKNRVRFEYVTVEHRRWSSKAKNEFGNNIVSDISANYKHRLMRIIIDKSNTEEERRKQTPIIIIDTEDYSAVINNNITRVSKKKDKQQTEEVEQTFVIRKALFSKTE